MHIVNGRNMLALPVERLLGEPNSRHSSSRPQRMSMSPDSSAESDISVDSSNNHGRTEYDYLVGKGMGGGQKRYESRTSPPLSSSHSYAPSSPGSAVSSSIIGANHHAYHDMVKQEPVEVDDDEMSVCDDISGKSSCPHNCSSPGSFSHAKSNERNNNEKSSLSSQGEPKKVPCSTITTTTIGSPSHHHTNESKHMSIRSSCSATRFSIDDILKPDFGRIAILQSHDEIDIRVSSPSPFLYDNNRKRRKLSGSHESHFSQNKISQPGTNFNCSNNNNNNDNSFYMSDKNGSNVVGLLTNNHSTGSHSRPSSVKNHSEDSNSSSCTTSSSTRGSKEEMVDDSKVNPQVPQGPLLWPAWVYCTRYSDRPSSGPRSRRIRKKEPGKPKEDEKRPRTAFTAEQLGRLKKEFEENRYLTEKRRQDLANELKLHENQIKIWFQNKRAKLKKSNGSRNELAMQLMAQGLYNHSTVPIDEDEEVMLM